jgi:hypothetical protein
VASASRADSYFGRDQPVAVGDQLLQLGPVNPAAGQIDADPTFGADVGGQEDRLSIRENRTVDKSEARQLLVENVIALLRDLTYQELVARFVGQRPEHLSVVAASGSRYFVEVQGFWDSGSQGPIRVLAAIDDGGRSAFKPLCGDFIKAEDNSFVGE